MDLRNDTISLITNLETRINPVYYFSIFEKYIPISNLNKIHKIIFNKPFRKKTIGDFGNIYCDSLSQITDILYFEGQCSPDSEIILDNIDLQVKSKRQASDILAHSLIMNTQNVGLQHELNKYLIYIDTIDKDMLRHYVKEEFQDFPQILEHIKEYYKSSSFWESVNFYHDSLKNLIELLDIQNTYNLKQYDYSLYKPVTKNNNLISPIEVAIHESKVNPNIIFNMNPHRFEEFIARIFINMGYNVELTKKTRDGGRDIFGFRDADKKKVAIEVKRYSPKNPISIGLVQRFVGANVVEDVTDMLFVTSSRYTKPSRNYNDKFNSKNTMKLELNDYSDIIKWINDYN